jgi:hypothetical protein
VPATGREPRKYIKDGLLPSWLVIASLLAMKTFYLFFQNTLLSARGTETHDLSIWLPLK